MSEIDVSQDPRDSSPLHRAAVDGDLDAIPALAQEPGALNLPGALIMTPLMTALIHQQEAAALRLIELGADVNRASAIGTAPLMTACHVGSAQLVQSLIDHGADIEYQLTYEGTRQGTALLYAAKAGRTEIVELLLKNGADANLRDDHGRTPLSVAAEQGHADVLTLLIGKRIGHREARGWTSDPVSDSDESVFTKKETLTAEDAAEIEATLSSRTREHRLFAMAMGIMQAGLDYIGTLERLAELTPEGSLTREDALDAKFLWARWLMGERISDRVDEAERRLVAIQSVIAKAGDRAADLMPMLARAILKLPQEHPSRDVVFALETLMSHARRCADLDRAGQVVFTVIEIVEQSAPVAESISGDAIAAMVELAESKIPEVDSQELVDLAHWGAPGHSGELPAADQKAEAHRQLRRQLRAAASKFFVANVVHAGETDNVDVRQASISRAREQLRRLDELGADDRDMDSYFVEAVLEELDDHLEPAADAYAQIVARESAGALHARQHEGRLRMRLEQYSCAVEALGPALPLARAKYLQALESSDVASTAATLATVTGLLAFALARSDRWDEALRALDQAKSLRLRHRAAMRASADGRRVLEIEAALYNIDRGIEPPASSRPPPGPVDLQKDNLLRRSLYLEEYRRVRPSVPEDLVESPSVTALAATLTPGEGVVVIGISFLGTMLALVLPADTAGPSEKRIIPDLDYNRLFQICMEWRRVLGAPVGYKNTPYSESLRDLLPKLDETLGVAIRALVGTRNVSRLTIVPHLWLHAAPFWALPSLESFQIAIAPSVGQLVAARKKAAIARRAAVVGDPTLDLPLSRVEAQSVGDRLSQSGFEVEVVVGQDATEDRVARMLTGAGLLHFSGHGRSDMLTPSRSALLLQPAGLHPAADPIQVLLTEAVEWGHSPTDGRFASLPNGRRLYEIKFGETDAREYFLEQGNRATLWARYQGDEVAGVAELWRAGAISSAGQFGDCGIVYLSACEVGAGCLGSIYDNSVDEYGGIPGALQLAGVPCSIASLWPVPDDLALVYVKLFYDEVAVAQSVGHVDVVAIVHRTANRIRKLTGKEAAGILRTLRSRTNDIGLQFRLDAAGHRVGGDAHPFAEPADWAAFFVTGIGRISLSRHVN